MMPPPTDIPPEDPAPDETLMNALRAATSRLDPPPAALLEASRAAFTWHTIDAELAALAYDSVFAEPAASGVRGAGGPRTLSFETDDLTVECEVHDDERGQRRLVGQVAAETPLPDAVTLTIRYPDGAAQVGIDDLGRFDVAGVPTGPVSVRIELGARSVQTEWVVL